MGLRRISLNLIIYILIPPNFQELCLQFFNFPTQTWFYCNRPQRGHRLMTRLRYFCGFCWSKTEIQGSLNNNVIFVRLSRPTENCESSRRLLAFKVSLQLV